MTRKSGPARTPTAVLQLRGSRVVAGRAGEPQPQKTAPPTPRWMNKSERAVWRKLVPELERTGVIARIDVESMGRFCTLTVWWHEVREFLVKHGRTYPVKAVKVNTATRETREYILGFKAFPQVKMALEYAQELRRLEAEFGLTPAARTRLTVEKKQSTPGLPARNRGASLEIRA